MGEQQNVQAWMESLGFAYHEAENTFYHDNPVMYIQPKEATFFYRAFQAEVLKARANELELAERSNMFRNQTGLPMFIRHEEYIESRKAEMQAQANKQKEVS